MRLFTGIVLGAALMAGCSSSDSSNTGDGGGNGDGGEGGSNDALQAIASTGASGQPVQTDIDALQAALDTISGLEPTPVEEGDTVTSLLQKAGL